MNRLRYIWYPLAFGAVLVGCGSSSVDMGAAPPEEEQSPLFAAIQSGDLADVQQELSDDTALANTPQGRLQMTPLHEAAQVDHVEIAQFLLDHGAEVNTLDVLGRTPLVAAQDAGASDQMQELLRSYGGDD